MSSLVYPRIDLELALEILAGLPENDVPFAYEHPRAVPYEVGAPAGEAALKAVRASVLKAVEPWPAGPARGDVAEWDAAVGAALWESMQILPADASHDGPWSFLTLVLLPDVAVSRFPERHPNRMTGVRRNVFRRTWARRHVLGDLAAPEGVRPLGEDELVNIFERSRMSRNHDLSRALAREILAYTGDGRSEFARRLTRSVRSMTGPLLLDVMDEGQLQILVGDVAERERRAR